MRLAWTDDQIATLSKMWAEGFSASVIGREIGTTRNSVIGKVHRLGLPIRTRLPTVRKARVYRPRPRLPKQALRTPIPEPVYIPVDPIRFINHKLDQCTFIAGEVNGPDTLYCGAKAVFGSSWCSKHITAVWAGIPPKKAGKLRPMFRRAA